MAEQKIFFRKDGITVIFDEGVGTDRIKTLDLTARDIQQITIEPCCQTRLFNKMNSERIKIKTGRTVHPIIYYREEEKDFFFEYKLGLRRFARDNHLKIDDRVDL